MMVGSPIRGGQECIGFARSVTSRFGSDGVVLVYNANPEIGEVGSYPITASPDEPPWVDDPEQHDLRRSAARDFRRAGVSEGEIMRACGWGTRSMFDRYNIIDEADLASAVAKRFNGKVTVKSEGFAEQAS